MTSKNVGTVPIPESTHADENRCVHDYEDYKPSRFRFKSHNRSSVEGDWQDAHRNKRRGRHHHGHHSRKRERTSTSPHVFEDPTPDLKADAAFRESLFDAMADDEGALYWEGVYGQPIHKYPNTKPVDPNDPDGEVARMTDEEYTAHVRARMWEKTHQHVIEERRLRVEAAKKRKETRKQTDCLEAEKEAFERQMKESLKKGARRRKDREWRDVWAEYTRAWEKILSQSKSRTGDEEIRDEQQFKVPWPTKSGAEKDIRQEAVETFFRHGADKAQSTESSLRSLLKMERVRWHPDRMSYALRGTIDTQTLHSVTAVFQIVDAMYNSIK